jgi:hypothetical protein
VKACRGAQVGWLVDFTRSAILDYEPGEGKAAEPSEKCLVERECLDELKSLTIARVREAAASGKLIDHKRLAYILFSWRDLGDDDGASVRAWTTEQLANEGGVVHLARTFTSEAWSHGVGMFGLADRVSMRQTRAAVDSLERIVDVDRFRRRLEELEASRTLRHSDGETVRVFLEAWRRREKGDDF